LAFDSKALQLALADIERSMYAGRWQDIEVEAPIFITSLPRAGTTIVLQALSRLCQLATPTYRDMPFILTPVLWDKVSRGFRRTGKPAERAHGDGLLIDEDSPEAFEEVVWRKYFPGHYHRTGIDCWQDSTHDAEFDDAFKAYMQKMILLRSEDTSAGSRYISKNNANIARIAYLQKLFPHAQFVVSVRHPVEQAISLMRQHRNFSRQHAEDAFTRRYMADIGHYEFGELHRPIRFSGLVGLAENLTPDSLDYWLAYWIVAFREVSRHPGLCLIGFEDLCACPDASLQNLLDCLGLQADKTPVVQVAKVLKPPAERRSDYAADPVLVEQAMACYKELLGQLSLAGETA
jgi:hypothetical protein